jgi:outer membrane biosynthesis protein TonB
VRTSNEHIAGWLGSIIFHALLLLVLFLINVPNILPPPEFVEMSWGSIMRTAQAAPVSSVSRGGLPERSLTKSPAVAIPTQTVAPPERRLPDLSDDVLRVPKTEKITSPETRPGNQRIGDAGSVGEREAGTSQGIGEKETRLSEGGIGDADALTPGRGGFGVAGSGLDQGVSFNVQWLGGGTRRKISGDLPRYPEGVNVEAQIRILAIVLPDGSVQVMQPAQKGNTRLEEAAMREVRYWKFEPLRPSQPQVEQKCEVVFLFTLK